jgi:hypothetical protein
MFVMAVGCVLFDTLAFLNNLKIIKFINVALFFIMLDLITQNTFSERMVFYIFVINPQVPHLFESPLMTTI